MAYKLATAYVDIEARTDKMNQQLAGSKSSMMGWLSGLNSLGGAFGLTLGIGAAVAAGRQFIGSAIEAQDAEARLRAVLAATGNAAGKTAEEILTMSQALADATGQQDEAITNASARLLTYKDITGDTFDRTIRLATDLAAIYGNLAQSTEGLARALDDPVRGLGLLSKQGFRFDR